jgi:DNA-binding beta-propeller fold protein YncE
MTRLGAVGTICQSNSGYFIDSPYILLAQYNGHQISKIYFQTTSVVTLAGSSQGFADNNIGTSAQFNHPTSCAVSPDGTFALIADSGNSRIRRLNLLTNAVQTIAGSSTSGTLNGQGTNAQFNNPIQVHFDNSGQVAYVYDSGNCAIRKLDVLTLQVTTIAGIPGSCGDVLGPLGVNKLGAIYKC